MRRLLSLLLLLAVGMPLWAPLMALGQTAESSLPACCRRGGKHHCADMAMSGMAAADTASQVPHWQAPPMCCPYCPASVSAAYHHELGTTALTTAVSAGFVAHPLGSVQPESKRRMLRDRARPKRGPPESFFA